MGYKPVRKLYELEFEQYPGLEVTARSASLGELSDAYDLNINVNNMDKEKRLEVFKFFEDKLISWNIEHPELFDSRQETCPQCGLKEDEPLPTTSAAMMCLEIAFVMDIIFGWLNTVARVSVPKKGNTSNGGVTIPEEVMQQLERLQNPTELPVPNFS